MTETPTPAGRSLAQRLAAAIRYVLALEPVAVITVIRALLVLLVAAWALFGFELDTATIEPRLVAVVGAFYALAEIVTGIATRRKVTPDAKVVEVVTDGTVYAGPASELPTGQVVRPAGSLAGKPFAE